MSKIIRSSVSGILVELLKKHGVRNIFGLPAGQLFTFMDAVSRDQYFRYVTARHEECAGHMAHGATIPAGEMALCFATVGPGATNLLPGVAAAWADNVPMIVLTANNQVDMLDPNRDLLQSVDQIALFRPVTKWSAQLRSAERAPELIERALHIARSGRPGPVHLDLPSDIATAMCTHDMDRIPIMPLPRPVPSRGEIQQVVDLLRNARRPLLVAGGGVVRSGGAAEFRAFAERTGFAAFTTVQGWGVVDPDSPGCIGTPAWFGGNAVIDASAQADVILAVGCKFGTWTPIAKPPAFPVPDGQTIIQVDIEDAMIGKNSPVTLGLVGDARETMAALLDTLDDAPVSADAAWLGELKQTRLRYVETINAMADAGCMEGSDIPATPAFMRELVSVIPSGALVCVDGGQTSSWAMTFLEPKTHKDVKFESGMGHMGAGLPMAIGAKTAAPDRTVVIITGDGSAGLTGQELETAARLGTKLVMVVFNDSCWGCYRPLQDIVFKNQRAGTTLTDVDFTTVAKGYGCAGERVTRVEDLAPAFARALASSKPTLLDVITDYAPHPIDPLWSGAVVIAGVDFKPHSIELVGS